MEGPQQAALGKSVLLISAACCRFSVAASAVDSCRDRFLEPFASTSIWNMAIGSNAKVLLLHPLHCLDDPRLVPVLLALR